MGLITVASLSNGCSPNAPARQPPHAFGPPWTSALSPSSGTAGIQRGTFAFATNSAVRITASRRFDSLSAQQNMNAEPPESPRRPHRQCVALSKQTFGHCTIIISNFPQSVKIEEELWKHNNYASHCGKSMWQVHRHVCLNLPGKSVFIQQTPVAKKKSRHNFTNLQRTDVRVTAG